MCVHLRCWCCSRTHQQANIKDVLKKEEYLCLMGAFDLICPNSLRFFAAVTCEFSTCRSAFCLISGGQSLRITQRLLLNVQQQHRQETTKEEDPPETIFYTYSRSWSCHSGSCSKQLCHIITPERSTDCRLQTEAVDSRLSDALEYKTLIRQISQFSHTGDGWEHRQASQPQICGSHQYQMARWGKDFSRNSFRRYSILFL